MEKDYKIIASQDLFLKPDGETLCPVQVITVSEMECIGARKNIQAWFYSTEQIIVTLFQNTGLGKEISSSIGGQIKLDLLNRFHRSDESGSIVYYDSGVWEKMENRQTWGTNETKSSFLNNLSTKDYYVIGLYKVEPQQNGFNPIGFNPAGYNPEFKSQLYFATKARNEKEIFEWIKDKCNRLGLDGNLIVKENERFIKEVFENGSINERCGAIELIDYGMGACICFGKLDLLQKDIDIPIHVIGK